MDCTLSSKLFSNIFLSQVSEDFLHTTMIYNKNPTTIRMKRVVETSSSLFTTTLAKSCLEQTHGSVFNELPLEYPWQQDTKTHRNIHTWKWGGGILALQLCFICQYTWTIRSKSAIRVPGSGSQKSRCIKMRLNLGSRPRTPDTGPRTQ